jgi:predicted HicB family RNase H-like nuclease
VSTPASSNDNGEKKIKQLTLRLPEDSHRKLKILAACSGKSMTEIIIGCIDERLKHCLERELNSI